MDKIRISAVKYANTYPFIYGLSESGLDEKVIIETDHPADCAAKLIGGKADLGLIPVAALPLLREYHIVGDYCIGASTSVGTVLLLSNSPFENIIKINLDYRSLSSVSLTRVLARYWWHKNFEWSDTSDTYDFRNAGSNEAIVLIGDQCVEFENYYKYRIDLATAWMEFTGLPFVFACWTANKVLDTGFISEFNQALRLGVINIDKVAERFGNQGPMNKDILKEYLHKNIDYQFDEEKKIALKLFLELLRSLNIRDVSKL